MAVKDISKIIIQGSPKQKISLLAEDQGRKKYGLDGLLTSLEVKELIGSLKRPKEIDLWNKWYKVDMILTGAIQNLLGLKYEVLMHYANLRGYLMIWDTIQEAEAMSNHILHEIKNSKERVRIAKEVDKLSHFLFADIEIDPEGYININIDPKENGKEPQREKEITLWYVMNKTKQKAIGSAIKLISWAEAILDFMEEEDFKIKTYEERVKEITEDIKKPIMAWNKYRSDEKSFTAGGFRKRADKLKEKYSIAPNIAELKADPEIYSYFKKEFLGLE